MQYTQQTCIWTLFLEDLSKIVSYTRTTQLLYKTWKFLTRQSEFYLDETMPFSANEIRIKMGVEDTI